MGTLELFLPIILVPFMLFISRLSTKHLPAIFFPKSPSTFRVKRKSIDLKNGSNAKVANGHDTGEETVTIKTFLETRVPSLHEGYAPTWWLPSGHLQTGWVVNGNFTKVDQVMYERTLLRLPDGGTIGLDVTPLENDISLSDDTPIVVTLHGLTGGSHESYVRSILASACAPKSSGGLGYRGVVVNSRGCAGVPLTSPQFYSAGHTNDLRCALLYLSGRYPNAPLLGIGFSMGANVLTRYLGEEGERSRLRAGVVLACPWDLVKNMARLREEFIGKHVYSKALASNLIRLVTTNLEHVRKLPPSILDTILPELFALKNPTCQEVDDTVTRQVGGSSPPFPFPSASDYYVWASSHKAPHSIKVPFLAINAKDDPIVAFVPEDEIEASKTKVAMVVTPYGGHLGWFEGGRVGGAPDRWVRRPVLEWLRAVGEDLVPDRNLSLAFDCLPSNDRVERDGWVLERGKDLVGYQVVSVGQRVSGVDDVQGKPSQGL